MLNVVSKKRVRNALVYSFLMLGLSSPLLASADNFEEQKFSFQKLCIVEALNIAKENNPSFNSKKILQFIKDYHAYEQGEKKGSKGAILSSLFASYASFLQGVDVIFTHIANGYGLSDYATNMLCTGWEEGYRDYLLSRGCASTSYLNAIHRRMYQIFEDAGHIQKGSNPVLITAHGISKMADSDIFMYQDENQEYLAFPMPKKENMGGLYVKNFGYGPRALRAQGEYCFIFDDEGLVKNPGYLIVNEAGGCGLEVRIFRGNVAGDGEEYPAFQNQSTSAFLPSTMPIMQSLAEVTEIFSQGLKEVFLPLPTTYEEYQEFRYAILTEIEEMIGSYSPQQQPSKAEQIVIDTLVDAFVVESVETSEDDSEEVDLPQLTQSMRSLMIEEEKTHASSSTSTPLTLVVAEPTAAEKNKQHLALIAQEKKDLIKTMPQPLPKLEAKKVNHSTGKTQKRRQKVVKDRKPQKAASSVVPSPSSSVSKFTHKEMPQGAMKQRKLAKLVAQMAREADSSDLQTIRKGSHINFHKSGSRSQTLVHLHGKHAKGISRYKGARILRDFTHYFNSKLQGDRS
ncbi:MAG: hypothetical protein ACTHJ4_01040, partial [Candidatus Nucleicultricaceae bacterium]